MEESKEITAEEAEQIEEAAGGVRVDYDDHPDQVARKFVKAIEEMGLTVENFRVPGRPYSYHRIVRQD